MSHSTKVIARFVFNMMIGTTLLCLVAAMAIFLAKVSTYAVDHLGAPSHIAVVMELLEKLVFGLDVICFVSFTFIHFWTLMLEIWAMRKAETA